MRREEYQNFPSKIFRLVVPKKFVGEPFRVSLISGIEKFYAWEVYVTVFRRIFFVSQYRKTLLGNPSVLYFRKFPVANKFMDEKGGISKFSFENFSSRSAKKIRRGTF